MTFGNEVVNFTEAAKTQNKYRSLPHNGITINRAKICMGESVSVSILGRPQRVKIFFNEEKKLVALQPCIDPKGTKVSYLFTKEHTEQRKMQKKIAGVKRAPQTEEEVRKYGQGAFINNPKTLPDSFKKKVYNYLGRTVLDGGAFAYVFTQEK